MPTKGCGSLIAPLAWPLLLVQALNRGQPPSAGCAYSHGADRMRRCTTDELTTSRASLQAPVSTAAAPRVFDTLALWPTGAPRALFPTCPGRSRRDTPPISSPSLHRLFHVRRLDPQARHTAMDRRKPGPGAGGSGAGRSLPVLAPARSSALAGHPPRLRSVLALLSVPQRGPRPCWRRRRAAARRHPGGSRLAAAHRR